MKTTDTKWLNALCLLFLFKPGIVSGLVSLRVVDVLFDAMRFLVMALCIMVLFVKRGKLPKNRSLYVVVLILFGEIWKIISTVVNGTSYYSWGALLNTFGIAIFSYLSVNYNKEDFFDGASILFGSYVVINTLTVFLFPNGVYASTMYTQNFFLSYRNAWFVFYLLALYVCLLSNELYPSKQKVIWLIIVITCEYASMIHEWTANSMLCITIGLILIVFWNKQKLPVFSVNAVFLAELAISVGLVYFHIQEKMLFFVVGILKRDPTLSQRVRIWNNALQAIQDKVWIGHGSMDSTTASTFFGYGVNHAHSYYLNTLFYYGVIGLIIGLALVYYAFSSPREKDRKKNMRINAINVGVLVALLTALQGESMMSIGYYACLIYIIAADLNSGLAI